MDEWQGYDNQRAQERRQRCFLCALAGGLFVLAVFVVLPAVGYTLLN